MSQNISLWGATYSDVPSVLLPKSGGGTASFTDVTDTTATASDVLAGKYFYTNAGVKTAGTGTGGGGGGSVTQDQDGYIVLPATGGSTPSASGLEYETGTWTPTADVAASLASFSFSNAHTTRPFHVLVEDTTSSLASDNSLLLWSAINVTDAYGAIPCTADDSYYMRVQWGYKGSSGMTVGGLNFLSENELNNTVSNSGFTTQVSSTRYFRSGRTYKWIAVWAPTT